MSLGPDYSAIGIMPDLQLAQALGNGLTITSASAPELNGTYGILPVDQVAVMAEAVSILMNGTFTDGNTSKVWGDLSMGPHVFTIDQFKTFATAVGKCVDAIKTQYGLMLLSQPFSFNGLNAVEIP